MPEVHFTIENCNSPSERGQMVSVINAFKELYTSDKLYPVFQKEKGLIRLCINIEVYLSKIEHGKLSTIL